MFQLLIIADDFTGALDTGVQFAKRGIPTRVFTDPSCRLNAVDDDVQVVVVDAETRHLSAARSYDIVFNLTRQAVGLGVPYIFKKTDSGLRGNIGAELTAVMTASGYSQMPFLPALPSMGRTTVEGIHYISGVPVGESIFSKDPFEPVTQSHVCDIIKQQSALTATSFPALSSPDDMPDAKGIWIFDSKTEAEIRETSTLLHAAGKLHIMAGCAGLGMVVPEILGLDTGAQAAMPKLDPRLLVLCGSVNAITLAQLKYAEEKEFVHIHLTPVQKLTEGYYNTSVGEALLNEWRGTLAENDSVIIDVNDKGGNEPTSIYAREHDLSVEQLRVQISRTLGAIMGQLFNCPDLGTLLITGGDTLLQCMNSVKVYEMEPIGEMAPGVVLSRFTFNNCTRFVISKSGGFGCPELLCEIKEQLVNS